MKDDKRNEPQSRITIDPRQVNILWASVELAAELAPMHAQLFEKGWDTPAFADLLSDPTCKALVARIGPPLVTVGFIVGRFVADQAEIITLGVAPEAQNCGIGRLLVEALIRAATFAQVQSMFLEVAADNDAAIKLYRTLDFKDVGQRPDYYPRYGAPPQDALVMARELGCTQAQQPGAGRQAI